MYSRFNTISGCDRQKDRETTLDCIVHSIERKKSLGYLSTMAVEKYGQKPYFEA